MVFDILLFGMLIGFYDHYIAEKTNIKRLKEELNDYRDWREKEASYRIFGILKRLYKVEQFDLDLSYCYFKDIKFTKNGSESFNFYGAKIICTEFCGCSLQRTNFDQVKTVNITNYHAYCFEEIEHTLFKESYMKESSFLQNTYTQVDFVKNNLSHANLSQSTFSICTFDENKVDETIIKNTIFYKCRFENTDFSKALCENIEFNGCFFGDNVIFPAKENYIRK